MPDAKEWPVTATEYHADFSRIGHGMSEQHAESPRHYFDRFVARIVPPKPQSKAMRIGSLAHVAILEPERWSRDFVCLTAETKSKWNLHTNAGRSERDALLLHYEQNGLTLVDSDEYEAVSKLREGVYDNTKARALLEAAGPTEHSIEWRHSDSGLMLKSRRDKVLTGRPLLIDLKTTDAPGPRAFARMVAAFGYHRGAAWYLDGHRDLTGEEAQYLFLVVSKTTFEAGFFILSPEDIFHAEIQNKRRLAALAVSYETNVWQAEHEHTAIELRLPPWSFGEEWEST